MARPDCIYQDDFTGYPCWRVFTDRFLLRFGYVCLLLGWLCCGEPASIEVPSISEEEEMIGQLLSTNKSPFELSELESITRESGQISTLYLLESARAHMRAYEYDSAGLYFLQILERADEYPSVPLKAEVYKNLGSISYYQEDYTSSIDHMLNALTVYEAFRDSMGIASALNNIAAVYYSIKDYSSAKEYFMRSMHIKEQQKDSLSLARTLNNLGNIYADQGDHHKAIEYSLRSAHIKEQVQPDNFASLASSYNNLALSYKNIGALDKAQEYVLKTIHADSLTANPSGIAHGYNTLSIILMEQGDHAMATSYANRCLEIADDIESTFFKYEAHSVLAQIYKSSGNYEAAFGYLEQSNAFKDALLNEEKNKEVVALQEKYESEKKENEITQLQLERNIQQAKSRKDGQFRIFLLVFLLLMVLLALSFWNQYRQKAKSNQLLRETNMALGELNALKDRLFATLSHDLKGPVSSFQAITGGLSANIDHLDVPQVKEYLNTLQQSAKGISHTLLNLLNWAKSQKGLLTTKYQSINLHNSAEQLISLFKQDVQEKGLVIHNVIPSEKYLHTDHHILEIALRNLLSNAIKYSPHKGKVTISYKQEDSRHILTVEDEGPGIPPELRSVLFDPVKRNHYDQAEKKEGSGIGLILVKESLQYVDGDITVDSGIHGGTCFSLEIPVQLIEAPK